MNDSFGAGGFNATAAGGAESESKSEGVLPLVIKQILKSPDSGITMFGHHYTMITIVAIVRKVEYASTNVTYQLEDHTGRINAHYWVDDNAPNSTPTVVPNSYARVVGSVRNQDGSKVIMIFKIDQVNSPNECTTHLLEVLHARYKLEEQYKRKVELGANTNANAASNGGFMETDSVGASLGLNGKQLAVYKAIKSHVSAIGIDRKELQDKFSHINSSEMATIMDELIGEGMIYSTIDGDHFLCVDA
ncbi:replication protein A 32 kDa subunit [Anopheles cruzii]|uniref:replication protein A 32 kDa subunit n=1 Tax=Anopheles cruzii TaxID=68878 RepID=UPI0022EC8A00|nr:replication protein A 32 kDa subunit [Anopheles cruzii]